MTHSITYPLKKNHLPYPLTKSKTRLGRPPRDGTQMVVTTVPEEVFTLTNVWCSFQGELHAEQNPAVQCHHHSELRLHHVGNPYIMAAADVPESRRSSADDTAVSG